MAKYGGNGARVLILRQHATTMRGPTLGRFWSRSNRRRSTGSVMSTDSIRFNALMQPAPIEGASWLASAMWPSYGLGKLVADVQPNLPPNIERPGYRLRITNPLRSISRRSSHMVVLCGRDASRERSSFSLSISSGCKLGTMESPEAPFHEVKNASAACNSAFPAGGYTGVGTLTRKAA